MNKPKLNQPDVEQTTTTPTINVFEQGMPPTIVSDKYPLKEYKIIHTLEECIKEWEEEGFLCEKTQYNFYIEEINGNVVATFSLLGNYFYTTMFINNKRLNLFFKTLKALESEEKPCHQK